ncbi:class I SAM-dependent methyltransferase [Thiolapillus sp.]
MLEKKLDHWSNYWATGYLTSLPEDFQVNYDGEIAEWWHGVFAELPINSKILDLCTGNGAIALLASKYGKNNRKSFSVNAIDASRIDASSVLRRYPEQAEFLKQIKFMGDCSVENTGLSSAYFDLLTSQYGVEYCNWSLAAKEIDRLLKPGGYFAFISHASSTEIQNIMEQEAREYANLHRWGFYGVVRGFLDGELGARETQKRLRKVNKRLLKIHAKYRGALLDNTSQVIQRLASMDAVSFGFTKDKLKFFCMQHACAQKRTKDMLRVTKSIVATPEWYRIFEEAGLVLIGRQKILQKGKFYAGEAYKFQKPT